MSKLVQISDAEWVVLDVLWRMGTATAADGIADLAGVREWNHRTVRTLLTRLVEKRALEAKPDGRRHVYRPVVSREKCVRQVSRSFLDKVFAGDMAELLIHFTRQAKIKPEQIARLRKLLDEKQSENE